MTNSILVIKRQFLFSFIVLVSTGIGSIFGFLELFGIGMIVFEKIEDFVHKKIRARKSFIMVIKKRLQVLLSFDSVYENVKLDKSMSTSFDGYFSSMIKICPNRA